MGSGFGKYHRVSVGLHVREEVLEIIPEIFLSIRLYSLRQCFQIGVYIRAVNDWVHK